MAILFENDHLQLLHAPGPSRHAVVTFNLRSQVANGRSYWGQVLAERHDVECYGIVTKRPNWFPAAAMEGVAAALGRHRAKPLVGYGHSMGGYGCLRYSRLLGLEGGLASAPFISIAPGESLGDARYHGDADPALHRDMLVRPEHLGGRLVLAYDPDYALDRRHAEAVFAMAPAVAPLRLPYLRHRTALALKPATVLLPLFEAILSGGPVEPIARQARQHRKPQPQYRIYLARALLEAAKPRAALRLLAAMPEPAVAEEAQERSLYLARAQARCGGVPQALQLLEALVAVRPDNPSYQHELQRLRQLAKRAA